MTQLKILMLSVFCLSMFAVSANADLILDLKYSDGSTAQTKNIGDTIFLDLSITETSPDTIIADEGLFSAGGRILRTVGNAVFGAPVATDVDTNWDLFDDVPSSSGTGVEIAKVLGTSFGVTPAFTTGPGFGIGTVKIAQFAVQITGGSGLSSLSADLLGSISGLQSFNGTTFDAQVASFGSVDLTVNGAAAVPEPASMILASLTAAFAGGGSYLRRRRLKQSAV